MTEFRFGRYLERAATAYAAEWRRMLPTMALLLALAYVAAMCCFFPVLIVGGPLAAGVFACAFSALDRETPGDVTGLITSRFVQAAIAGLLLGLLFVAIFVVFYVVMYAAIFATIGLTVFSSGGDEPGPLGVLAFVTMYPFLLLWIAVLMALQTWLGARLMFVFPLIADRDMNAVDAIRESWEATRSGVVDYVLLLLTATWLSAIGIYFCYVGVLVTTPFLFLAIAAAYRDRFSEDESEPVVTAVAV